jgi:ribosomal protein S18 acetylase RimI-like enzyme
VSEDASAAGRIEVREARNTDIPAIRGVAQTTWDHTYRDSIPEHVREAFLGHAYSADSLRKRIASNVLLVARKEGNIVGFADFRPLSAADVELAAIYVLPEVQSQGVGGRLVAAGIARFAAGMRFVLRVERDNASAQRFYEARGYKRSGESSERLCGHEFHHVVMSLDPGS